MIVILTIACFGLGWLARAAGSLQPPNPALAGFTVGCEGKPQPCWYGIVPGMTSWEEANRLLLNFGYSFSGFTGSNIAKYTGEDEMSVCDSELEYSSAPTIASIQLQCADVSFGDLAAALGSPKGIESYPGNAVRLIFKENISVLESGHLGWASLFTDVRIVDLISPISNQPPPLRWLGLIPAWRYCQLESLPAEYC